MSSGSINNVQLLELSGIGRFDILDPLKIKVLHDL